MNGFNGKAFCSTNAGRNPVAIYRDPMTMDDYFDARMISTPTSWMIVGL
jgi:hypothetical protein